MGPGSSPRLVISLHVAHDPEPQPAIWCLPWEHLPWSAAMIRRRCCNAVHYFTCLPHLLCLFLGTGHPCQVFPTEQWQIVLLPSARLTSVLLCPSSSNMLLWSSLLAGTIIWDPGSLYSALPRAIWASISWPPDLALYPRDYQLFCKDCVLTPSFSGKLVLDLSAT